MRRSFNFFNTMFKPSLTIHKSPKGKLSVLSLSEDADDAVKAYVECADEGEIQLVVRGQLQKQKKIDAPAEKPKKKAKAAK